MDIKDALSHTRTAFEAGDPVICGHMGEQGGHCALDIGSCCVVSRVFGSHSVEIEAGMAWEMGEMPVKTHV